MTARVLVIGSGGREHALAWKLRQSPLVGDLFVAPGNAGTDAIATNIPISPLDSTSLATWAKLQQIDLAVIGPDNALALGVTDCLTAAGIATFGPTRRAAIIEASKVFAKDLMAARGIPTAPVQKFTASQYAAAYKYLHWHGAPIVVKGDGLMLGKGVTLCHTIAEAEQAMGNLFRNYPGQPVLLEDFLVGPEVSLHAICNDTAALFFPPAQDYKRLSDSDLALNTGGMGAVTPLPHFTAAASALLYERTVWPILHAMHERNTPFTGCLYPGLLFAPTGWHVLEYNARFGDPETQSYMRLLTSDLYELLHAAATHAPLPEALHWQDGYAVCVVLAAANYPGQPRTGDIITGIENAAAATGVEIFHAGTIREGPHYYTNGGRVLNVTAVGATLAQAKERALLAALQIQFFGKQYRRDIGHCAEQPATQWRTY